MAFEHALITADFRIIAHQRAEGELFFKRVTKGMPDTPKFFIQVAPILVDHGFVFLSSSSGVSYGKFTLKGKRVCDES